ncbi:hypothetical protein BU23DRAFT_76763 [Bimuria novae-zelandiae CBS 107.79]|uniref:Uncharacterized protein n=1 Tax=Bimuria novae-zelandiae CBS 107.79 TaxID=1447943 RepID=A0A6A5VDK6_9PLEO|nr:hypothetical protein BU23DRAFT_76763 [Bimuria novae-zelandiae CBS 107.79]
MLLKNLFVLGLAAITAASPILEDRAGKTGTAVGGTTGTKGKGGATCKNTNAFTPVTCPRVKFTAAQIERAVKQAKAMKLKGKTGKGLHFPAKYKPTKEAKAKGAKAGKAKAGKPVKRDEDDGEDEEDEVLEARDEEDLEDDEDQVLEARDEEDHVLEARARGGRGGAASRTRPKPTRKTKPKTTKPKTTKPKTTPTKKPAPKKDNCNGATAKPGKGIWMFPILEKGAWKREYTPYAQTSYCTR